MDKKGSLTQRICLTIGILLIVEFLSQIPLLGINREMISLWVDSAINSTFGMLNMFSGNSFQTLSIFALGIAPYITSSIILQLLRVAIPKLDRVCKDAKSEKEFVEKVTVIGALFIGIIQTIPVVINIANNGLLIENNWTYRLLVGGMIFIGSLILIGLGKFIDKKGIGKGISLILLVNILSSFKTDLMGIYGNFIMDKDATTIATTIAVAVLVIVFSLLVVIYLHEGKKDVKVVFSGKFQNGRTVKPADSSIPLKVNMSGVMPVIFASTLIQIVPMIVTFTGVSQDSTIFEISKYLNQSYWFIFSDMKYTIGVFLYFAAIVFFAYFYTMISFNTRDIAENLNRQGGTIAGIRPGKSTQQYLDSMVKYMVLLGALMLIVVTVIPMLIGGAVGYNLSFGGTSIIIIVSVLIETYKTYEAEKNVAKPVSFTGF